MLTGDLVMSVRRTNCVHLTRAKWWKEFWVVLILGMSPKGLSCRKQMKANLDRWHL